MTTEPQERLILVRSESELRAGTIVVWDCDEEAGCGRHRAIIVSGPLRRGDYDGCEYCDAEEPALWEVDPCPPCGVEGSLLHLTCSIPFGEVHRVDVGLDSEEERERMHDEEGDRQMAKDRARLLTTGRLSV